MRKGFFDLSLAQHYRSNLRASGIETTIAWENGLYWVTWVKR